MLPVNMKSTNNNEFLPPTVPIDLDEESKTYLDIYYENVKDNDDIGEYRQKTRTRLPRKFDKQNKRKLNKLAKQSRRKNRN